MAKSEPKKKSTLRENLDGLVQIVILVALVLGVRSFVVEPFKIPSGSMIPTLLVGDYVLVNKFSYGLRLPVTGALLVPLGEPERGDVIVFRYPDDPSQDYIKRVVGLPGDTLAVEGGQITINGKPIPHSRAGDFHYFDWTHEAEEAKPCFQETTELGAEYRVIHNSASPRTVRPGPWVVPEGKYFMMGDNRDNSRDSRLWRKPFVDAAQIKGRAFRIHWSWVVDSGPTPPRGFLKDLGHTLLQLVTFQIEEVRWSRIGRSLAELPACSNGAEPAP